jgi:hypothetical protein
MRSLDRSESGEILSVDKVSACKLAQVFDR